jgi:hypothetical protein
MIIIIHKANHFHLPHASSCVPFLLGANALNPLLSVRSNSSAARCTPAGWIYYCFLLIDSIMIGYRIRYPISTATPPYPNACGATVTGSGLASSCDWKKNTQTTVQCPSNIQRYMLRQQQQVQHCLTPITSQWDDSTVGERPSWSPRRHPISKRSRSLTSPSLDSRSPAAAFQWCACKAIT